MSARLVIVGIDGGTFDVAAPWAQQGVLPNLARLMERGCWGDLFSTYPPITAAAWSSLMTGCNPGKHGVYDFLVRDPASEDVVDARAIRQPTMWQLLSRAGRRVGAINVPVTFPPEQVNGVMISGCLSPSDPDKSAWPVGLIQEIEAATGRRWWQYDRSDYRPSHQEEFVDAVQRSNETIAEFVGYLLDRQAFDVFMVVFSMVDTISHFFWHYMDPEHPLHREGAPALNGAVQRAYQTVDRLLGEVLGRAGGDADCIVVSDHGFGPITRMVNLNNFLIERGYLALRRSPLSGLKRVARRLGLTPGNVLRVLERVGLDALVSRVPRGLRNRVIGTMGGYADVDWDRTVCYSRGHMGQIYFTARTEADEGAFAELRERVVHDLKEELRDPETGLPLVSEVLLGEEIYSGPHSAEGPGLFLVMDDWRAIAYPLLSSGPELVSAHIQKNRCGNHRMNGMFCACGPSFRSAGRIEGASVVDVAPMVLCLNGICAPAYMDGHVLEGAVAESLIAANRRQASPPLTTEEGRHRSTILTDEEERERRERLRGLGYL